MNLNVRSDRKKHRGREKKQRDNDMNVRKFHPLFNNNKFISESEHDKGYRIKCLCWTH